MNSCPDSPVSCSACQMEGSSPGTGSAEGPHLSWASDWSDEGQVQTVLGSISRCLQCHRVPWEHRRWEVASERNDLHRGLLLMVWLIIMSTDRANLRRTEATRALKKTIQFMWPLIKCVSTHCSHFISYITIIITFKMQSEFIHRVFQNVPFYL